MSAPDRIECDEVLLEQHIAIKDLLSDLEDILRCNQFDVDVKNELVFVKEKADILTQSSLLTYQRFR